MKCYGYSKNNNNLLYLSEVTVQADPSSLRELAKFIYECANEIELDDDWEHEHFVDASSDNQNSETDFIVFNPRSME
jgi:hypothetical protein